MEAAAVVVRSTVILVLVVVMLVVLLLHVAMIKVVKELTTRAKKSNEKYRVIMASHYTL